MNIGDFIKTNINRNIKWNINGTLYSDISNILDNLKEGCILN